MKDNQTDREKSSKMSSITRWTQYAIALIGVVLIGAAIANNGRKPAMARSEGNSRTTLAAPDRVKAGQEEATLSGGCFWAMEAMFSRIKGVQSVNPGYAGGKTKNPSYEAVCTETTGHAETIDVIYDPKVISYKQLMTVFFDVHDPTTLNRQGDDEGTSYRSMVFYHNAEQKAETEQAIDTWQAAHPGEKVVTQVVPFDKFYVAEGYHHHYFEQNPDQPYCQAVVAPKVEKFKAHFATLLK